MSDAEHDGRRAPPVPDIVDYLAEKNSIEERVIQTALLSPRLRAAVAAYRGGYVPLGYAGAFSWDDVSRLLPNLRPERLLDLIRHIGWRRGLDASDPRHVAISRAWALAESPELFKQKNYAKSKEFMDEYDREMGDFAESHRWRKNYHSTPETADESEYAEYWFRNSSACIQSLLSDRRFQAGVDALHKGKLSHGGFLENVFGDGNRVLFPELGWHMSALVLNELVRAVDRGDVTIPDGLAQEFPDFYEFYDPEAFGRRG